MNTYIQSIQRVYIVFAVVTANCFPHEKENHSCKPLKSLVVINGSCELYNIGWHGKHLKTRLKNFLFAHTLTYPRGVVALATKHLAAGTLYSQGNHVVMWSSHIVLFFSLSFYTHPTTVFLTHQLLCGFSSHQPLAFPWALSFFENMYIHIGYTAVNITSIL